MTEYDETLSSDQRTRIEALKAAARVALATGSLTSAKVTDWTVGDLLIVADWIVDGPATSTDRKVSRAIEYGDLEHATRLDGSTMPASKVLPDEHCWCGGPVGARVPGDSLGLGCLTNITHDWTAASQESQELIESQARDDHDGLDFHNV